MKTAIKHVTAASFVVVILFLSLADLAYAGFGITPPYFRNTSLTRNSIYEQQIILVRGDPTSNLKAEITVDAPEIEEWLTIIEGDTIPMPAGERKVPMTVRVQVPSDVEFKDYTGKIRIKTVPDNDQFAQGAVNISLGAQVDIDLTVIDREIKDFRIRRVGVSDLNEGHKLGWLYFPGKIRFAMLVENTGNINVAPSKVAMRIFDGSGKVLLEETESLGRMNKIIPYATEEIVAEIPTRLPSGPYVVRYDIYNDEEIKQSGELNLSILPYGTLQTAGFGFTGLSLAHKASVLLPAFTVISSAIYLIYFWRARRRKRTL